MPYYFHPVLNMPLYVRIQLTVDSNGFKSWTVKSKLKSRTCWLCDHQENHSASLSLIFLWREQCLSYVRFLVSPQVLVEHLPCARHHSSSDREPHKDPYVVWCLRPSSGRSSSLLPLSHCHPIFLPSDCFLILSRLTAEVLSSGKVSWQLAGH